MNKRGYFLLELIVVIAILLVIVPGLNRAYLTVQKNNHKLNTRLTSSMEYKYLLEFLNKDLMELAVIDYYGQNKLYFRNIYGETVQYELKDGLFKRYFRRPGKSRGKTDYLTKNFLIGSFEAEPCFERGVCFRFFWDGREDEVVFYGANRI